ncbi:27336_t:CDS:1, partial [Gigaspora margarita]
YDVVKENDEIINDHPVATPDYLTQLIYPGISNYKIHLKTGAICSIMQNISIDKGLVKNVHVIITNLHQRLIEIKVLKNNNPTNILETYLFSRINFYFQPDYCFWIVHRKQFLLRLAYSTTFNSSQDLILDCAVIDLRTNIFAHGQLYTAIF